MSFFKQYYNQKLKMDPDGSFDKNRILNLFAFVIESLSLFTNSIMKQNTRIIRRFTENFQIAELFDAISDKLAEHPPLRFIVFATALSCAIPVVMFVVFGVTSVIITFAGFLFIEGTLLAVGGLCMFICILTLILALTVLGMTLGVFYMLGLKLEYILNKFELSSGIFRSKTSSVGERQIAVMSNGLVDPHQD